MSSPDEKRPSPERQEMSLTQVQRWIISLLIFVLCAFPVGGLIGLSHAVLKQDRTGSAIGLAIMSGVIGTIGVAGMRIAHQRSLLTPLLLLGMVPALIGAFFVFR